MPPLPSHRCEFTVTRLLRTLAGPVAAAALLAVVLHVAGAFQLLPQGAPGNLDQALLREKVRLASDPNAAAPVLILGDSSALMNVSARLLAEELGTPVLNLATLSHVDLAAQAELLRRHLATHPAAPTDLILLLHPEALWRGPGAQPLGQHLRALLDQNAPGAPGATPSFQAPASLSETLGGRLIREHLIQALLPTPLRGAFGHAHGTTWEIARELRRQNGSLQDPSTFQPGSEAPRTEYRLDPAQCTASEALQAEVPATTRLWLGLTPSPESVTDARSVARRRSLLDAWARCLRPHQVLAQLPESQPDADFASLTHLRPAAVPAFTRRLGQAMRNRVP